MRSVTVEIAGESIDLPVNFKAGEALANAGVDPLKVALNAASGTGMSSIDVITVLVVGAKAAGSKLTRDQIGNAVYEDGVVAHLRVVNEYLSEFVNKKPEYPDESKKA